MDIEHLNAAIDSVWPAVRLLLLLGIANGTPIFAKKIFGARFAQPLDCGVRFFDGRPLLGPSKTVRGVLLAIGATTLVAPMVGLAWSVGAALAALSMLGDLGASFIKRRVGLRPSSMAFGLDQVPESALPLLVLKTRLGLGGWEIVGVISAFVALELILSRLLFKLHVRDRPY